MFIRSQDKKSLYNLNAHHRLVIADSNILIETDGTEYCLCSYATPERALEVFEEFCSLFSVELLAKAFAIKDLSVDLVARSLELVNYSIYDMPLE